MATLRSRELNLNQRLQKSMVNAAEEAGRIALKKFGKRVEIERKGPKDYVSEIDRRSEETIIARLKRDFPSAAFLGEESGAHSSASDIRFIIDPLDATTNYIKDMPHWSVMIAAEHEGVLCASVVHIPPAREMFTARLGEGAFLNNERIRVSAVSNLDEAVISLNRSNFPTDIIDTASLLFRSIITSCGSIRDLGTAGVEYSMVARGRLDGIITPIAEEVHTAGYLLMSEAGAVVTDTSGVIASIDSKTIVAANPVLHSKLRRLTDLKTGEKTIEALAFLRILKRSLAMAQRSNNKLSKASIIEIYIESIEKNEPITGFRDFFARLRLKSIVPSDSDYDSPFGYRVRKAMQDIVKSITYLEDILNVSSPIHIRTTGELLIREQFTL